MVVNPTLKFDWINEHWAPFDRKQAYGIVKDKEFQRELYKRTLSENYRRGSTSSQAQVCGYLRVLPLGQNIPRASSPTRASENPEAAAPASLGPIHSSDALPAIVHGPVAPSAAGICAHNLGVVEYELNRYIAAGTVPVEVMGALGLTEYWKASSVSSEHVFSSRKLTHTSECNRISSDTLESLQILKHSLYRHRSQPASQPASQGAEGWGLDFKAHKFENLELAD